MTIQQSDVEVSAEEIDALVSDYQRTEAIATLNVQVGDKPISPRAHKLFADLAIELRRNIVISYGTTLEIKREKSDDEIRALAVQAKWLRLRREESEEIAQMAELAAEREASKTEYFNGVTV